jgi:glycosyltransferase involved in cell wall biosynthesis
VKFRDPHRTEVSNPPRRASRARAGPRDPGGLGPARSRHLQVAGSLAIAPSVSVVIPAKNEASNLPHVFASLPQWVDQIVLVDGHSVDGTAEVASRLRPDITIVSQQGRGKGDALLAGFAACIGDIIVTIDADGSTDGGEIVHFIGALTTGADFAKGSRFASGGGSDDITVIRRWGNAALSTLVNRVFGTRYTDLCYGYNAFWARHLPALDLDCSGFEIETLMNVRAARSGLRVREVPSHEHSRVHGVSNLRAMPDGWRILKVIIREWRDSRADGPPPAAPVRHVTRQGGSSC